MKQRELKKLLLLFSTFWGLSFWGHGRIHRPELFKVRKVLKVGLVFNESNMHIHIIVLGYFDAAF